MRAASALLISGFAFGLQLVHSANWAGFRGPSGDGRADGEAPLEWSRDKGVAWRQELPGPGNGSPIVSGDKVFITCSEDARGTRRSLYCFDAETGRKDWVRTVEFDKAMPTHKTNPHCSTTPAAGGGKVVVWHGSAGLYCYDHYGVEEWHKDLGEFRHMWGYGASPIVRAGVVYLYSGPGDEIFVAAIDLTSGDFLWRVEESLDGGNAERTREKHYRGSWATPVYTVVDDKPQLICTMPTRVIGYDAANGAVLWTCDGIKGPKGELAYSSPMLADGVCVSIGGFSGPSIGFRLGGKGDVTGARLWRNGKNPQSIGTGIYHDGYLYVPDAGPAGIRCIDPETGAQKWHDPAGGKNFWGSVVMAGGRAYVTDQVGDTYVFEPSPEGFKKLAVNSLGEACNTTPAVAGGAIYIRTDKALYRIGKAE